MTHLTALHTWGEFIAAGGARAFSRADGGTALPCDTLTLTAPEGFCLSVGFERNLGGGPLDVARDLGATVEQLRTMAAAPIEARPAILRGMFSAPPAPVLAALHWMVDSAICAFTENQPRDGGKGDRDELRDLLAVLDWADAAGMPRLSDRLAASDLPGHLTPLRFPRFMVVQALDDAPSSWRDVVMAELAKAGGAISLSDLYRAIARHPKAADAPNWRPKVRQTLQRAGARRVGPGQWEIAQ